jgi:hypothetical protein
MRGIGTGELGELEPGGEGNENRAIGELYKPVITGKMEE